MSGTVVAAIYNDSLAVIIVGISKCLKTAKCLYQLFSSKRNTECNNTVIEST